MQTRVAWEDKVCPSQSETSNTGTLRTSFPTCRADGGGTDVRGGGQGLPSMIKSVCLSKSVGTP